nr:NADH-quinone oxidoreductase subunit C [Streptomyces sp. SID4945]
MGCTYFDWLSAVDEPGTGFRVCAHVVALAPVRRLLLRTTVPHETPALASAVGVYAGAAWHERETHEMFGLRFEGHPGLTPLLLPETFEGHPLRKDFVLAARVAKAWPGAKEPGESGHGTPKRRQMLPPGVPDPNEWGPLKGQLPEAPARPARRTRTAGGAAAGTGTAAGTGPGAGPGTGTTPGAGAAEGAPARRGRSASAGSASQREEPGAAPARRSRTASEGSATQRTEPGPAPARRSRTASEGSATQRRETTEGGATPAGSPDAPWHHARPAFEDTRPSGEAAGEREKPRTGTRGAEAGSRGAETGTRGAEAGTEADVDADAASRAGKPPAEEPGTEEPRSEKPGTEEPRTEEPRAEEPGAEDGRSEERGPEGPRSENSRPEDPRSEDPRSEDPRPQDPQAPRPEDPPTQDPRPENPAGGEPA